MPFSDVRDLSAAHALVRDSGAANAGILIDTLHFNRSPSTLAQLESVPKALFHYAQLNDAAHIENPTTDQLLKTAREERLYLGEGVIPVREIVNLLPDVPLSLEIAHVERQRELGFEEFARTCLQRAKLYFGQ